MPQFLELAQHKFNSQMSVTEASKIIFNFSNASANCPDLSSIIDIEKHNHFILNSKLEYSAIEGSISLRSSIAKLYENINRDNILVFSGAQEAITSTYCSILESGDEVIVITPCYQSLKCFQKDIKVKFVEYPLREERGWNLSCLDIEQLITNKTKMITLNFPHNPTGTHLNLNQVKKLIEIAKKYNLYLLADEVSSFSVDSRRDFWCLSELYDKAISICVMSKSFGLSGLRIGWAITRDKDLLKNLKITKTYLSICVSKIDEHLTEMILDHASKILTENNEIIRSNVQLLKEIIPSENWIVPKAGIVCLVKINQNIYSLYKMLLKKNYYILPGFIFGQEGNYFRLGLGNKNTIENFLKIKDLLFSLKTKL